MKKLFLAILMAQTVWAGFAKEKKTYRPVRIAMAQIFCLDGDRSGNLVRIENALKEASKNKVELIAFPESAILGWQNPEAYKRATPIPGEDSDLLCGLAKKYKMFVCIGLDEKDGDKLYDSAILIDDSGQILMKHRKVNVLPEYMNPPYTVGERKTVSIVKTKFGNIGILICADTFQSELLTLPDEQKLDVLLVPYGWNAPEGLWPGHGKELQKVVVNASKKLNCSVVGTDLVGEMSHGPFSGEIYGGQSIAYDNKKDRFYFGADRDKDLVIFTLNL